MPLLWSSVKQFILLVSTGEASEVFLTHVVELCSWDQHKFSKVQSITLGTSNIRQHKAPSLIHAVSDISRNFAHYQVSTEHTKVYYIYRQDHINQVIKASMNISSFLLCELYIGIYHEIDSVRRSSLKSCFEVLSQKYTKQCCNATKLFILCWPTQRANLNFSGVKALFEGHGSNRGMGGYITLTRMKISIFHTVDVWPMLFRTNYTSHQYFWIHPFGVFRYKQKGFICLNNDRMDVQRNRSYSDVMTQFLI